uniref:Unc-13 homolog D n=1 Tax=Dicentrarchus labrax TaxID=13489 RepID=A0A8C4ILE4_DICLA
CFCSKLKPLYKELLYTITHKMGNPSSTEVFTDSQLHQYIKEAAISGNKYQTKGILGKDVSGFSDPYCLLTILEDEEESRTRRSRAKPCKSVVKDAVSDDKIYQTDIKKQTLNPIWNQTFVLEFGDIAGDSFHLEMCSLCDLHTNSTDDFLGKVVLKLQDLHCTEDNWYNLEPRTETYPDRGQCHLNLKFIHKGVKVHSHPVTLCWLKYQVLIFKAKISSAPWKGALCGEAQTLLELYATQNDLSPFLQDLAKWVAYSKLYQSLEVDSSVLFQQLTSVEYHWHQQELPYQQKQELGDSLHGFLQYGLCLVAKYRDIFPPSPSATPKLHTLLRILVQICKTQAFQKLNPAQFDLHDEVSDAIQTGTQEWFSIKKGLHQPMTKVNFMRVFTNYLELSVIWFIYLCHTTEVMLFLHHVDIQDLSEIVDALSRLITEVGLLELTNFQEGFREALPYWLNQAFSTTQDRVERAVQVDKLQPLQSGAVPIKHSSSAVDLVACIQPICQLWEQLSWPDPEEAFMLMVKLTEDVCKIVVNYCHILKERVRVLSENSDHGSAINMLCVVVNDLEHLRSVLTRLPTQLNWAGLRDRTQNVIGESQFHNTLPSQLQQAQSVLGREIRSALDTLGKKVRDLIPSKSTEDVAPLMRYLEQELHYMNENLVQENFNSLLTPLWNNSVKILYQVATQHSQQEGLMVFCQRLLYTLQCLEQCFHAEGNGLPLNALHSDEYKVSIERQTGFMSLSRICFHFRISSDQNEKENIHGEKYGAVTLLTSYRRSDNKLRVEVLNAVNLLPMDSNGFSDPFVQLCLEPNHIFPEIEPRCTQIKNCDLNPLFDEAFEFMVSLDQCQAAGACLVVTVLDHDTLRTDDFEGEAFLALKGLPGVPGGREGDGLSAQPDAVPAQIRLPLMHPKPNEDSILRLLESRKGEREAQAFVKKRRQREKQSQEGIQL